MAITQTLVRNSVVGDRRAVTYDVTFDNVYVTNGWPLSFTNDLPAGQVDFVDISDVAGLNLQFDYTNKTIRAYYGITSGTTAGAEIGTGANAANAKVVRVRVIGY